MKTKSAIELEAAAQSVPYSELCFLLAQSCELLNRARPGDGTIRRGEIENFFIENSWLMKE